MVIGLVRDAVKIKMAAKEESPLISAYEFCYAAGLGCRILGLAPEKTRELAKTDDFAQFKQRVQELTRNAEDAFAEYPNGSRLYSLLTGCRYKGAMNADARKLFELGLQD